MAFPPLLGCTHLGANRTRLFSLSPASYSDMALKAVDRAVYPQGGSASPLFKRNHLGTNRTWPLNVFDTSSANLAPGADY